jgi:hypothetical protein
MKTYASIENGAVREIVFPKSWGIDDPNDPPAFRADDEQPIEIRFPAEFVATLVDITEIVPQPDQRWTYSGESFSPPPIYQPTPAEVLASQSTKLVRLKQLAEAQKLALTNRIATLQDAIDNVGVEGMEEFAATPEEQLEFPKRKTQLTKWKNYAILLGRVTSQTGWPPEVTWPPVPEEGMDLSVSSMAPTML